MEKSAQEVANAWIEKWNSPNPATGEDDFDLDFDIPANNPALCLEAIVEVLKVIPADPANTHFQVLAAGPLEDLICINGESVIEQMDTLCRRSPEFRLLLNGAWLSRAPATVLARLEKYQNNRW